MSSNLEYYEQIYYGSQVEGRNLTTPSDLKRAFDVMCREYEEAIGGYLPNDRSAKCLDLACGYGNFLYYLQRQGFSQSAGVDLDERQVALAKSLGLDAKVEDASQALDGATNYSLVSALDLVEHLDKNVAVRLLQKIHSSLKPGGVLVLRCPCTDGFTGAHDMTNDLTHRWSPSSNMLGQLLRTTGFGRVRIVDISLPPFPSTIRRRLMMEVRRLLRRCLAVAFKVVGVETPRVWSNSQYAVAWRDAQVG